MTAAAWTPWLGAIGPLALLLAAAWSWRAPVARALVLTRGAAVLAVLAALASIVALAIGGAATAPALGSGWIALSFRLDALSALMLTLVSGLGLVVLQFSRNYLAGDPRQPEFLAKLCLTLAAVLLLVSAGNLFQLAAAWIGVSTALQGLLLFLPKRPRAIAAARKKFVIARLKDAAIVGAAVLLARAFGTDDIAAILQAARASAAAGTMPTEAGVAAGLLAVAALLKSAQFPTHGWLTEVMETPTPVSALLHAGVVNAGGFLVIRFADVIVAQPGAMAMLLLIGGFTALFGSLVMLAQTSIKVSLAYSTVAQMGFMLMQCGLGAFASAALHILAHSLYKAYAFLSSGEAADKASAPTPPRAAPGFLTLATSFVAVAAIYVGVAAAFDAWRTEQVGVLALGAIFMLGVFLLVARSLTKAQAALRVLPAAALAAGAYFALQAGAHAVLAEVTPAPGEPTTLSLSLAVLAVVSFTLVALAQAAAPGALGRRGSALAALRVHAANGFYANALFDRLVGALRIRRRLQA